MSDGSGDQQDVHSQWSEWRFLIDENLHPDIATQLHQLGFHAEYTPVALFEGADDIEDILPYCRETNAILVSNNVRDFNPSVLAPEDHAGIVIVHDKDRPSAEITDEIRRMVTAYMTRDAFPDFESADDWH